MSEIETTAAPAPGQAAAPTAPPPVVRKSPEDWARQKGHVFRQTQIRHTQGKLQSVEPRSHLLEGARVHNRWVVGELLTEAEFDRGMASFLEEPIR